MTDINYLELILKAKEQIVLMGYFFDEWVTTYQEELKTYLSNPSNKIVLIEGSRDFNVFTNQNYNMCTQIYTELTTQEIQDKQVITEKLLLSFISKTEQLEIYYTTAPFFYNYINMGNTNIYSICNIEQHTNPISFISNTKELNKDISFYISKSIKATINLLCDREFTL
jgi:hypothetical protein